MTISLAHPAIDADLLQAAADGAAGKANDLIDKGADIDCRGEYDGRTPLHMAALNGQKEMARQLLGRGARREIFDNAGDTPLHLAARHGHDGVVQLFVHSGFNVDLPNEKTGETPLMAASHDKALGAAALLLAANADTDAQDARGETALMKAAKANQPGAAEALIKRFADICMRDNDDRTAYGLAKDAKAGAVLVVLHPHVEASDREKTYAMTQKLRSMNKISVGRPLKFRKPGGA